MKITGVIDLEILKKRNKMIRKPSKDEIEQILENLKCSGEKKHW